MDKIGDAVQRHAKNKLASTNEIGTESFFPLSQDWVEIALHTVGYNDGSFDYIVFDEDTFELDQKFQLGDRVRFKQSGGNFVYSFLVEILSDRIRIEGGNNYNVTNGVDIDNLAISRLEFPIGFPSMDSFIQNVDLTYTTGTYIMDSKSLIFWMTGNKVEFYYDYTFHLNAIGGGSQFMRLSLPITRSDPTKITGLNQYQVNGIDYHATNIYTYLLFHTLDTTNNRINIGKIQDYNDGTSENPFDGAGFFDRTSSQINHVIRGYVSYLIK